MLIFCVYTCLSCILLSFIKSINIRTAFYFLNSSLKTRKKKCIHTNMLIFKSCLKTAMQHMLWMIRVNTVLNNYVRFVNLQFNFKITVCDIIIYILKPVFFVVFVLFKNIFFIK